jgi:NADH:ubiquinone oxidoreductase subunit F (NADH-binding)
MANIIDKLNKAKLVGRGGACFPTGLKWEMVKKAVDVLPANDRKSYVVCNASEGEPGIEKDWHILVNYPDRLIDGMMLAIKYLKAEKGYIYLNPHYYKKISSKLKKRIGTLPIVVFYKDPSAGYVGGEESSALNHIEGKRIEPRLRPPFPPTTGLWGYPTLVNNVETFYDVSLVAENKYDNKRFYTINGDCLWNGTYELPEDLTIEQILRETENYPDYEFFVQAGGDAAGEVLRSDQLGKTIGEGSITVYSVIKHDPLELMRKWAKFFYEQSCGQCTPCREGTLRLYEVLNEDSPDWKMAAAIMENLRTTSFCGLGTAAPVAISSFVCNVLPITDFKLYMPDKVKQIICEHFC